VGLDSFAVEGIYEIMLKFIGTTQAVNITYLDGILGFGPVLANES